jgi:hypothetical protein
LDVVVNQVGKDAVAGNLSEPKQRMEELADNSPAGDRTLRLEARTDE